MIVKRVDDTMRVDDTVKRVDDAVKMVDDSEEG